MRRILLLVLLASAFLWTCNTRRTTGTLSVTGKVSQLSDSSSASPLEGATVRAGCDLDGDGTLQPVEQAETTTAADGTYTVSVGTLAGKPVSIFFSDSSTNTAVRSVPAVEGAQAARFDVALVSIERLECASGSCVSDDKGLRIDGLAANLKVRGRTFNPVDEAFAMPGGFVDDTGALLVSGVFATVEVEDRDGNRVGSLASPATLRMRLPRETWAEVVDIRPGDDRIQVPMYAFDEAKGSFVREGDGFLEDGAGAVIPESALLSIRSGALAGAVFSRSEARHFSTWNVDWPMNTQTCLTGLLVHEDGRPAAGLTVETEGVSYTGSSPVKQTDAEGRYCVPVFRSEKPGEDVGKVGAGNGVPGEQQKVAVIVRSADDAWDLGELVTPDTEGCACTGGKKDTLSAANRLVPRACTVTGTVQGIDGGIAAPGTFVAVHSIFDVPASTPDCTDCRSSVAVDADGGYSAKEQVLAALRVRAMASRQVGGATEIDEDVATARACPSRPIPLKLRPTTRLRMVTLTRNGSTVDWSPALPATNITVMRGGSAIWLVTGTAFLPPVTVGVAPPGTTALLPYAGSLATGDVVTVSGSEVDAEGVTNTVSGSFQVP